MAEPVAYDKEHAQAYYPDQTPIPSDKLAEAVASGQARWREGAEVPLIDATGRRVRVPAEEVYNFLAPQGPSMQYRLESPEEADLKDYQATANVVDAINTGAAGTLSAITLGGFEALLPQDERERIQKGYETFGAAKTIGEVLGTAAAVGIGGARLGAGAARALGAVGTRGAIARGAVSGAVESGWYGAGREVQRQALGDEEFAVEKVLSAGVSDAVLGGAVGGGLGAILSRGSKAFKRVGDTVEGDVPLGKKPYALQSLRATADDIAKMGGPRAQALDDELIRQGVISPFDSSAERLAKLRTRHSEIGREIGESWRGLDELGTFQPRVERVVSVFAQKAGELRAPGAADQTRLARMIEREWIPKLQHIKETGSSFEKLHDLDVLLRKEAGDKLHNPLNKRTILQELRTILKQELRAEAELANPQVAQRLLELDNSYSLLSDAMKWAPKRAASEAGLRGGVFSDLALTLASASVGSPWGAVYAGSKMVLQSPRTAAALALMQKRVANTADTQTLTLAKGIKGQASENALAVASALPPVTASATKDFATASEAPRDLEMRPAKATQKIARAVEPLTQADPQLGARAATTLAADLQWLRDRMPRPIKGDVVAAVAGNQPKMAIPLSEMAAFTRRARALANPIAEVLRDGLNPAAAEVLAERRPKLKESVERHYDEAQIELAKDGKVMSYEVRVKASLLTGKAYDFTMSPEFIRMSQAVWAANRGQAAAQKEALNASPGPQKARQPSNRARDRLKQLQTPAQMNADDSDI